MDLLDTLAPHWWWLVLGLLLATAEIIVPGVFLIWLGAAALVTGVATLLFGLPVTAQFLLFALCAVGAVYAGRRWISRNPIISDDPLLNDRTARLIGRSVIVVEAIAGGEGRVRVDDGVWPAEGPDAPAGARVRITGARGACLLVAPDHGRAGPNS